MDEYISTQTLRGRIPVAGVTFQIMYCRDSLHVSDVVAMFLMQCNNNEFCEYYFRRGVVDIPYVQIYKSIIMYAEPSVFFHAIREFGDRHRFLEIRFYEFGDFSRLYDYSISYISYDINKTIKEHYNDIADYGEISSEMLFDRGFQYINDGTVPRYEFTVSPDFVE